MAVKGNLRDMSLVNIISINCNERNQSRLVVRDSGREAVVFFKDGQIVHASLDSQQGEDVIYELLAWGEGEFELEQGIASPMQTVTAGWSGMLLKGLSRIDESKAGLEVAWDEVEAREEQGKGDRIAQRMVRALQVIDGIEEALLCSREGAVLGQDTDDDLAEEAALVAFVGRRVQALGGFVSAGSYKHVILVGEKRKVMIVPHKKSYVGLFFAKRTSVESMIPVIQMTLRRYR